MESQENSRKIEEHENAKPQNAPQAFTDFLKNPFKIGLLIITLVCLFGLIGLGYYFLAKVDMKNEIVSVLIPQPFTENNDFMYFHLENEMKVLMVKPNSGLNNTYICLLISSNSRCWFGKRH